MSAVLKVDFTGIESLSGRDRWIAKYKRRGWTPIRLEARSKKPDAPGGDGSGWPSAVIDPAHPPRADYNIGVLLGTPSGGLVDFDFDATEAATVAKLVLPPGPTFGRKTSPGSHRLVRCIDAQSTEKFSVPADLQSKLGLAKGTVLEVRANGGQTMFPPSIHPEGETLRWELEAALPRMSWADALRMGGLIAALSIVLRTYPGEPGSRDDICMALAGALVSADYDEADVDRWIVGIARLAGDDEADSRAKASRTAAQQAKGGKTTGLTRLCEKLGLEGLKSQLASWLHPARLVLDPSSPWETAKRFVADLYTQGGIFTLARHKDDFLRFEGGAYRAVSDAEMEADLYRYLEKAGHTDEDGNWRAFNPNKKKIADVVDALAKLVLVPDSVIPPVWRQGDGIDAHQLIACKNTLLHLPTGEQSPQTPDLFTRNALDFDFNPDAGKPVRWLAFLKQLWPAPEDQDQIDTLQEMFGYMLVPDTSQQKIFMLLGPTRSGKGTIARVLRRLVGAQNSAGPTMGSLGEPFGLEPLIGKQLAVIADARIGGKTDSSIMAERLLTISGEDEVTCNRKYKSHWTGQLSVRFLILTNVLPRIRDASATLPKRFITLTMKESFLGKENPKLADELLAELPGILRWAIDGWRRLKRRGHFNQPNASVAVMEQLEAEAEPMTAWMRERCVVGPAYEVRKEELFADWKIWCERQGQRFTGTLGTFTTKLRALSPKLGERRERTRAGRRVHYYVGLALGEV